MPEQTQRPRSRAGWRVVATCMLLGGIAQHASPGRRGRPDAESGS